MEDGEEDIAVRLAFSDLPEVVLDRDKRALVAMGLEEGELGDLMPAVIADPNYKSQLTTEDVARMERTISHRWADLVTDWVARS